MTIAFPNPHRKKSTHRKAHRAAYRFLCENHEVLVALLKLLGHHDLAARLATLFELASRGRVNLMAISGAFAEAHSCLADAPSHLEGPHNHEWSDLDAALRWMGAQLEDFHAQMRSLRNSRA